MYRASALLSRTHGRRPPHSAGCKSSIPATHFRTQSKALGHTKHSGLYRDTVTITHIYRIYICIVLYVQRLQRKLIPMPKCTHNFRIRGRISIQLKRQINIVISSNSTELAIQRCSVQFEYATRAHARHPIPIYTNATSLNRCWNL